MKQNLIRQVIDLINGPQGNVTVVRQHREDPTLFWFGGKWLTRDQCRAISGVHTLIFVKRVQRTIN